jgi:hypothetical protein
MEAWLFCRPVVRISRVLRRRCAGRGQRQTLPAVTAPTAGDCATADVRVITPGVVFSAGLSAIAATFTKEIGKKVGIVIVGWARSSGEITTNTPPPL